MNEKKFRLYHDLAWLWPLWGDTEEYRQECELFASFIREASDASMSTLLDVGCGGGKNMFHFKKYFRVTGIDISEEMLSNAAKLNPECELLPADMRTFELGRQFDAIFLNDSIVYMTTEEDLLRVFRQAHKHLRSGGIMLTFAEYSKESFIQNNTSVSTSRSGDIDVAFIENNYDPDPKDTTFETAFVYLIRRKGKLTIEHDLHVIGLFPLQIWRDCLGKAGFEFQERVTCLGQELHTFICRKR